jgi:hypothetical protein
MIRITDPNAFAKLTKLEGQDWANGQRGAYSFVAFRAEYDALMRELRPGDKWTDNINPGTFCEDYGRGDGAIYGKDGVARFIVTSKGEIVLLGSSTHAKKIAAAKRLGFKVRS